MSEANKKYQQSHKRHYSTIKAYLNIKFTQHYMQINTSLYAICRHVNILRAF